MLFLIALILAFGFSYLCRKIIKKQPAVFYIAALIISALIVSMDFRGLPSWINTYIIGLFSRGAFATALWCVVMWTGAFPNGSKAIKVFMPIRGELSIFAALLTLGHNIGYGKIYFVRLFTDAGRMSTNQIAASILTLIMLAIMIPLTVISFPKIRRKINAKRWKKIQRLAYLFYGMIYLHVMILCIPSAKAGREGYWFSIFMYSAVFIGYGICRVRKWVIMRKKLSDKKLLNTACAGAFAILVALAAVIAGPEKAAADKGLGNKAGVQQLQAAQESTSADAAKEAGTLTANTETKEAVSKETAPAGTTAAETTATETTAVETTAEETKESETETEETSSAASETSSEETAAVLTETTSQIPETTTVEAKPPETTAAQVQEPSGFYKNGTYTASAFGYDGDVEITITVENDVITGITGVSHEGDTWYYESAENSIFPQILSSQSCEADTVSGATYSSKAIIEAAEKALEQAKR